MALVGLSNYCTKQGGSYVNAQYVPIIGVSYFVPIMNGAYLLYQPSLAVGYTWLSVPMVVGVDRPVSERTTDTKQGVVFDGKLSISIMPLNPGLELELETMKGLRDFLVKFTDKNGYSWLMGDLDTPAVFDYDYATTKTVVSFACKSPRALRAIN